MYLFTTMLKTSKYPKDDTSLTFHPTHTHGVSKSQGQSLVTISRNTSALSTTAVLRQTRARTTIRLLTRELTNKLAQAAGNCGRSRGLCGPIRQHLPGTKGLRHSRITYSWGQLLFANSTIHRGLTIAKNQSRLLPRVCHTTQTAHTFCLIAQMLSHNTRGPCYFCSRSSCSGGVGTLTSNNRVAKLACTQY